MMKACVLHAVHDLRYEDVKMPEIEKDEVLLKIRAAGICGSDIQRVFEKGTYHFPTVPGHEFSGEVVALGADADHHLLGRRAAVFPLLPCRTCSSCQIGEYAQCKDYDYYGSRRDGGFGEYLAVKAWNLVLLPETVTFEEAAMCEPVAVAIHALSQAGIGLGDTVGIFGAGTIGLLLAKIAKAWGAGKVILSDVDERKLDFARSIGFAHTINSRETDTVDAIMRLTDGKGLDVAVEGSGASVALENCLKSTKTFGKVVLMGNPLKEMTLNQKAYWEILRKQLTLKGTWNSSYNDQKNDWKKAIDAMPLLKPAQLITQRYDFSQCNEAFQLLKDKQEFALKVMFVKD